MAALEPLHGQFHGRAVAGRSRLGRIFERDVGVQSSGTAHIEFALGLRVEIQQNVAAEQPLLQAESTVHAGLFRGGEERLDRSVSERIVFQHGEDRRRADAVVGSERRAVGRYPLAVDVGFDGVLLEIELLVVVLLRHHVQMGLQDDALAVLHAFGRRFAHIDVVRLILAALQSERTGHVHDVLADLLLVVRGTGNVDDLCEMLPDLLRLQSR